MVVGDFIVKNVKGWKLSTKDDLFSARSFFGEKTDYMQSYIKVVLQWGYIKVKPTLISKPERIIIQ